MELKTWVKLARTNHGWTQDQLAAALEVTKGNISAWENGRHEPSWDRILRIGRLTGEPLPIPLELLAPLIKHLSDLTSEKVNEATTEKRDPLRHTEPARHRPALEDGVSSIDEAISGAESLIGGQPSAQPTTGKRARQSRKP